MILTDDLLAISQPKTGSTWRRRHLAPIIGADTQTRDGRDQTHAGHSPLHGFSDEAIATRQIVSVVRNPFDHLVSIYCHMRGSIESSPQIRQQFATWANGEPTWEAILYGWTHPWERPNTPDRSDHVYNPGGLPVDAWRALGVGFYSWHARYFHTRGRGMRWRSDVFVDCARQSEAFAELYPAHSAAILDSARANVGQTSGEWWTPERLAWVRSADGRSSSGSGMMVLALCRSMGRCGHRRSNYEQVYRKNEPQTASAKALQGCGHRRSSYLPQCARRLAAAAIFGAVECGTRSEAMSKPTRKPKVPHGCVILEPGEKPPKGAVMCRWGSSGPGYHPGRAAKWKGKVYASPDFPMAVVADWLG